MANHYYRGKAVRCRTPFLYAEATLRMEDGSEQQVSAQGLDVNGRLTLASIPICPDGPQSTASPNSLPEEGRNVSLPEDERREDYAMADGLLDYFPNALAEVAAHSKRAMQQHGLKEFKWHRGKSTDHRNKIVRHTIDAGKFDDRGNRHSVALAWRSLALLQEELERDEGYPLPRGARAADETE